MKMPKDRYDRIKAVIRKVVNRKMFTDPWTDWGDNERCRWNLLWKAYDNYPEELNFSLYEGGINDGHIDTALRNIMADLGLVKRKVG